MSIKGYFGFEKSSPITVEYPESFSFVDTIEEKLEYLRAIEDQEHARMTAIESKTSQLIGMTSIIFTLIGIFVSNYLTKLNSLPNWLQIVMIILFLLSLAFYVNTIFQASRYMEVNKHFYGQRSASTVCKKFEDANAFKVEEVKDLIYVIQRNTKVTNLKINYLLYGYRSFKVATLGVGALSIVMLVGGKFSGRSVPNEVVISQPVTISHLDSSLVNSISTSLIPKIVIVHDTVYRKK
jgi:hypothetical protein